MTASRLAGIINPVAVRAMHRIRKASFIGVFIFLGFLLLDVWIGKDRIEKEKE